MLISARVFKEESEIFMAKKNGINGKSKMTKVAAKALLKPLLQEYKEAVEAKVAAITLLDETIEATAKAVYDALHAATGKGSEKIALAPGQFIAAIKRENKAKGEDGKPVVDDEGNEVVTSTTYFMRTSGEKIGVAIY